MSDLVEIDSRHRTVAELADGLDAITAAPSSVGTVELIVARPAVDERVELASAKLDVDGGLVADRWSRGSRPNPRSQLTVMNARAARLVAGDRSRWSLAGDQLYVDFDLSPQNIPPGTRLAIGSAEIQVSEQPHLGCEKFAARFGEAARAFANSPHGTAVNMRGINTRIVKTGIVRTGDSVRKVTGTD